MMINVLSKRHAFKKKSTQAPLLFCSDENPKWQQVPQEHLIHVIRGLKLK